MTSHQNKAAVGGGSGRWGKAVLTSELFTEGLTAGQADTHRELPQLTAEAIRTPAPATEGSPT